MDCRESTPWIAFISPERGSGKTRALEVTEPLVPNPIHAVNVTPAYRFRKVGNEEAGLPTILYDEVDTLFGSKVQYTGEVRGLLNAGHRRGAVAGRCVVIGKKVMTEEIPGRKPGSPNKVTLKREAEIAASGLTPLEFMLQQLRDKTKDDSVGMYAAVHAAPYCHPKLSPIEQGRDDDNGAVTIVRLTDIVGVSPRRPYGSKGLPAPSGGGAGTKH
jgi:hypothetical protein